MIWIIAAILVVSVALNITLYRRSRLRQLPEDQESDESWKYAIENLSQSGANIPDLSIELTRLASSNLESVEVFKSSTKQLEEFLQSSSTHFHQIDQLGQENILSIERRIEELQGFMKSLEQLDTYHSSINEAANILDDIASQTSILALNASVEASRAGTFGKGFSVIAQSVRDLATKSLNASDSIREATAQSQAQGAQIAQGVSKSSGTLHEIFDNINQILESLKEGLQSFEENFSLVNQIVYRAEELDSTVKSNLRAVGDSSQIGIKLGIHLDELRKHAKSSSSLDRDFIKPEHVFHFNFTNTLPALYELLQCESHVKLPKSPDTSITPQDVYLAMTETISEFRSRYNSGTIDEPKTGNILPIDVLKLSVAFHEAVEKVAGKSQLENSLVLEYSQWRQGREVVPSDVYSLVTQFRDLLSSVVKKPVGFPLSSA